eukprot:scaffold114456_cov24-Attheya_sp.AAC.1
MQKCTGEEAYDVWKEKFETSSRTETVVEPTNNSTASRETEHEETKEESTVKEGESVVGTDNGAKNDETSVSLVDVRDAQKKATIERARKFRLEVTGKQF